MLADTGWCAGIRTLLDSELPAGHVRLAGENAPFRLIPGRERRPLGVDVREAQANLIAPRALDLGLSLAGAVEELEREDGALFGRQRQRFLEELIGSLAHAGSPA